MRKVKIKNGFISPKNYTKAVFMEDLFSNEMIIASDGVPRPVLHNINLAINKGELWGITGPSLLEIKLLLEIVANIKPYKDGKCVLLERGMMRLKRIILPHVFYIGTTGMAYNNMNVLEFLMFANKNRTFDVIRQQERIFEQLLALGLGNISLTPITALTPKYKVLILLLTAYYSSSQLIVLNLPDLKFAKEHIAPFCNIARLIQSEDKTLILSSTDLGLIESVCTHTAILTDGTVAFAGGVREFCQTYDRIVLTIYDARPQDLMAVLKNRLPRFDYSITDDNRLIIKDYKSVNPDLQPVYQEIAKTEFTPERIVVNRKNYKNAYEEIIRRYDLQKQLL